MIEWLRSQPLDLKRARRQDRGDAAGRAARAADGAPAPGGARQARGGADVDPRLPRLGRAAGRVRAPRRGAGGGGRALPGRAAPARRGLDRAREAAIDDFQEPDGPQLIVCATRVAAQGITLTRASNVCFLELEWTPAIHDQAEDRCHRIGQRDAVTAWYLLAAETIDETMARLIQRKREIVDAVTDGRELPDGGLIEGVVRELRDGKPFRHLRAVASDTDADAIWPAAPSGAGAGDDPSS